MGEQVSQHTTSAAASTFVADTPAPPSRLPRLLRPLRRMAPTLMMMTLCGCGVYWFYLKVNGGEQFWPIAAAILFFGVLVNVMPLLEASEKRSLSNALWLLGFCAASAATTMYWAAHYFGVTTVEHWLFAVVGLICSCAAFGLTMGTMFALVLVKKKAATDS